MIDLQQMSVALSLTTRRSLVIIDEFGKGTESQGVCPRLISTLFTVLMRQQMVPVSLLGSSTTCSIVASSPQKFLLRPIFMVHTRPAYVEQR